jgi:Skp family chaperone for outer membrane proteins
MRPAPRALVSALIGAALAGTILLAPGLVAPTLTGVATAQDDDSGPLARPAPEAPAIRPAPSPRIDVEPAEPSLPPPGILLPFLFINQERLLTDSQSGRAILADEDKQRDALRAEARTLDQSFEAEEKQLTDQRPTLPVEDFRKLSDAFDARVVQARHDQDNRASSLAQEFDQRRRRFYAQVAPILVSLMDRYGAKAIFDETSVLMADQSLNITQAVIAEIDAHAGEAPVEGPPETAPAEPAPPAADQEGGN